MCEVDVTCLIEDTDLPFILSHSRAEAGEANKWDDALVVANERQLPGLNLAEAKAWARDSAPGKAREIETWNNQEMTALVLQYAAGDLRELQSLAPGDGLGGIDWAEAEALADSGTCGGRLFQHDGHLFIYIGI